MAQHEATNEGSYLSVKGGDDVHMFSEGGTWWVAFIYGDQSPQFIRCDTEGEARKLFDATRERYRKAQA